MLPQYILIGVGDVFSSVGILEFFYEQSPQGMQSLGTTFFTSGLGVGNFLNSLLVTAVDRATRGGGAGKSWIGDNLNDSHLDYYYAFLLLLAVINLAVFVWVATRYEYRSTCRTAGTSSPGWRRGRRRWPAAARGRWWRGAR